MDENNLSSKISSFTWIIIIYALIHVLIKLIDMVSLFRLINSLKSQGFFLQGQLFIPIASVVVFGAFCILFIWKICSRSPNRLIWFNLFASWILINMILVVAKLIQSQKPIQLLGLAKVVLGLAVIPLWIYYAKHIKKEQTQANREQGLNTDARNGVLAKKVILRACIILFLVMMLAFPSCEDDGGAFSFESSLSVGFPSQVFIIHETGYFSWTQYLENDSPNLSAIASNLIFFTIALTAFVLLMKKYGDKPSFMWSLKVSTWFTIVFIIISILYYLHIFISIFEVPMIFASLFLTLLTYPVRMFMHDINSLTLIRIGFSLGFMLFFFIGYIISKTIQRNNKDDSKEK